MIAEKRSFPFTKMHGIGNDFVLIDFVKNPPLNLSLPALAREMCDRKFGVGADGIILIEKGNSAPFSMKMFNPDGSEAEMCGNGIRCLARLVKDRAYTELDKFPVETKAGILEVEVLDGKQVRVNMGKARTLRKEIPMHGPPDEAALSFELVAAAQKFDASAVSMGNPHCVIFVEDVEKVPLDVWGPAIEYHELFPQRTNVQFTQVLSNKELKVKTWERGAGATLACGTGACAAGVASFLRGLSERSTLVHLPGGDLTIEYIENGTVYMTGPAEYVFEGEWDK
ncbi:MAG TPA: diaminopimelate epimerase [Fimbriimonadales bacterium]|nr:diaminopimelate epimerase [Fimbriimonadales bacterium]